MWEQWCRLAQASDAADLFCNVVHSKGETPEWDSNLKKYVYADSEASSIDMEKVVAPVVDPQANQEQDSDLPF